MSFRFNIERNIEKKTSNKRSATLLTQFRQQSIRCSSDFLRFEEFGSQKTKYFTGIKLNLKFIEKCRVFMYYLTIMFLMDFDVIAQVFRYRPYHELEL